MHQVPQQQIKKEVLRKMLIGAKIYFEECVSVMDDEGDSSITDGSEDYSLEELVFICRIIDEIEKGLEVINKESIRIIIE